MNTSRQGFLEGNVGSTKGTGEPIQKQIGSLCFVGPIVTSYWGHVWSNRPFQYDLKPGHRL